MEGSLLAFCFNWMSDCFQQCGSALLVRSMCAYLSESCCTECVFDFRSGMMTIIWMLDENWKSCDHMSGILLESLFKQKMKCLFIFHIPCFSFSVCSRTFLII